MCDYGVLSQKKKEPQSEKLSLLRPRSGVLEMRDRVLEDQSRSEDRLLGGSIGPWRGVPAQHATMRGR